VFVSCLSVRVHTFIPQAALGECERPPPIKTKSCFYTLTYGINVEKHICALYLQPKNLNLSCAYPLIITEYIIHIGSEHAMLLYIIILYARLYIEYISTYILLLSETYLSSLSAPPSHILYYLQPSAYLSFSISH
jgi:hypothetical protein